MKTIAILLNPKTFITTFFTITVFMLVSDILIAQTSVTIYSSADNFLNELASTENTGGCDRVYVTGGAGTRERGLFKFNLSSIPAGAVITSGTLYLYRILGTGSGNVNVHRVMSDWTEGTGPCQGTAEMVSNWNQRAAGTNWTTAGGDYNATVEASAVSNTVASTVSWNILSLIQGWYNGTYSNYGLIIKGESESTYNQMTFATREYTTTTKRAKLVIIYTVVTPVELVSFNAKMRDNVALLDWVTATEVNNYGFEIERSKKLEVKSEMWEKIGFVNGNGNSNSPKDYSFVDDNVTTGKYSYRLKQIDNDGQFEYSKSIEVNLKAPKNFELNQNYPNPFNPGTTIRFSIPEAGNVKLNIFNSLGEEVANLVDEFREAGTYKINYDASGLSSGIYFYQLRINEFTSIKKMLLIK